MALETEVVVVVFMVGEVNGKMTLKIVKKENSLKSMKDGLLIGLQEEVVEDLIQVGVGQDLEVGADQGLEVEVDQGPEVEVVVIEDHTLEDLDLIQGEDPSLEVGLILEDLDRDPDQKLGQDLEPENHIQEVGLDLVQENQRLNLDLEASQNHEDQDLEVNLILEDLDQNQLTSLGLLNLGQ